MKFNWGHGIIIFMIAFMIVIVSAVYYTTSQTVELVEEDYYQKEVTYQQTIDAKKNSKYLQDSVELVIDAEFLKIVFAPSLNMSAADGKVNLYRPNNSNLDRQYLLKDYFNDNEFKIRRKKIISGKYSCSIHWSQNGNRYIWEKDIYL